MNLARAKRRWRAWDRYYNRVFKLCGYYGRVTNAYVETLGETAAWRSSRRYGRAKAWRMNRRTGWRR